MLSIAMRTCGRQFRRMGDVLLAAVGVVGTEGREQDIVRV